MDYEDLQKLNKKFAIESSEFTQEFFKLHKKWLKKSPRMTMIMTLHLPINMIMNAIADNKIPVHEIFPELPDMFIRFVAPFIKLRTKWGKIPGDQFQKEYKELYESQFDKFFASKENMEFFKNWFEVQQD
jgi:hypothetical protein